MNKRDLSVSMAHANLAALMFAVPVGILQATLFNSVHGTAKMGDTWNLLRLLAVIIIGVVVHELLHGLMWTIFGRRPLSAIKFGFQWKTLTPYAHLKEPVEVNAYRIGAFMPGFILGLLTYLSGLILGEANLFWFGLVHTTAAGGDWLILWLIRDVKDGAFVEDHPSNAGCYVYEE